MPNFALCSIRARKFALQIYYADAAKAQEYPINAHDRRANVGAAQERGIHSAVANDRSR
jgi:hypothetical protein